VANKIQECSIDYIGQEGILSNYNSLVEFKSMF